jgi:hypothetical protein
LGGLRIWKARFLKKKTPASEENPKAGERLDAPKNEDAMTF